MVGKRLILVRGLQGRSDHARLVVAPGPTPDSRDGYGTSARAY